MAGNNKVKKYRKPLNLNPGMIIFAGILLYVIICVIIYINTEHIVRYQVLEGSLTTNNNYRGIALRDETVYNSTSAGYINFYAREGSRVAVGDLVYTLDETGKLSEYFDSFNMGENTLSESELLDFRSDIINFEHSFEPSNFDTVYDFKYTIKNTVLKLANSNMLQSIDNINDTSGLSNAVNFNYAQSTGIVTYWVDGYESLTADSVTADYFDEKNYNKNGQLSNSLVAIGDPAYKISYSEDWSIVIPIDEDRGRELEEKEYVKVKFSKNQYESWAKLTLHRNSDGNVYAELGFTNSMITFVSDRFIDVELIIDDERGLKIPNSSIVQKEFYLIPDDFVTQSGEDGSYGVIRQCYLEDGSISTEFISTDINSYDENSKEYYIDTSMLDTGDVLYKLDSQETYTVSRRATLIGVYNMNKGYADFKQILILSQNSEYAIVKPNTKYGLSVYDYIVLDAASVTDDQFLSY